MRGGLSNGNVAAWNAAADLAFVAPDVMVPRLIHQIKDDLDSQRITKFSPLDIAIARHPEGSPFVDVLSTKPQRLPGKGDKDYDTLKWEEELRAEMAKKRGQQQKKLTAEEHAKVKVQLEKESEIRKDVRKQEQVIRRGAGIIQSLAKGPATGVEGWINPAVSALCGLVQAGAGELVGSSLAEAYLACTDRISTRLHEIRPFIGIATLRSLGKTHLPTELEGEPLGSKCYPTLRKFLQVL